MRSACEGTCGAGPGSLIAQRVRAFRAGTCALCTRPVRGGDPRIRDCKRIDPGWPDLYGFLSDCKLWTGSISAAIPLIEWAIAISPGDPYRASCCNSGSARLMRWLEKARSLNPRDPQVNAWLVARSCSGRRDRAGPSRTRQSSRAELRRPVYESCPVEGRRVFRRADGPKAD